jgi:hypothetical protein
VTAAEGRKPRAREAFTPKKSTLPAASHFCSQIACRRPDERSTRLPQRPFAGRSIVASKKPGTAASLSRNFSSRPQGDSRILSKNGGSDNRKRRFLCRAYRSMTTLNATLRTNVPVSLLPTPVLAIPPGCASRASLGLAYGKPQSQQSVIRYARND